VGGLDGVVDVEVGDLLEPGQDRRVSAQGWQDPGRDSVQLPDVPEAEGPQEDPQRRRSPHTGEQPAHPAVA